MPRWYDTQYNLHATDNLEYPFTFNSTSVTKKGKRGERARFGRNGANAMSQVIRD